MSVDVPVSVVATVLLARSLTSSGPLFGTSTTGGTHVVEVEDLSRVTVVGEEA